MTINSHTSAAPTIAELRAEAAAALDDLCRLLADAHQWADDVTQTIDEDDPRSKTADAFAVEIGVAADEIAEGVHWFDHYPVPPDSDGWDEGLFEPSQTVQPSGALVLFDGDDGQPQAGAEVEHTRQVRESDLVARAGELQARADLAHNQIRALDDDTTTWRDWTDQEGVAADQYADHAWFRASRYAMGDALAHLRTFEHDSTEGPIAATPASAVDRTIDGAAGPRVSTAAQFADSTDHLLAFAEDIQQRTHGWVDDVRSVHGHGSTLYERAVGATDSVDHTVSSLRHVSREFILFDHPDSDGTTVRAKYPADTREAETDARAEMDSAEEVPARADLADVGRSVAVDMDELSFNLASLRDEATDWRHAHARTEADDDPHRLEHVYNAGAELDDANAAAQHASWELSAVAPSLRNGAAPTAPLPERSRDRFTARPVGRDAHADLATIAADSEQLLADAIEVKEQARPWFTATYNSIHVHEETYAGATLEAADGLDSTIEHLHSAIGEMHWTTDPDAGSWRGPTHEPLSAEYDDGETRPYHFSEHGIMAPSADLSDEAAELADATQEITWRLQGIDQRAHGWLTDAIDNEADHATLQRGARAVSTLASTTAVSQITHRTFERSARTLADQPEDDAESGGIRTAWQDHPEMAGGRETSPFDHAARAHDRVSESVAAAENGLHEVRHQQARARAQADTDDVARWHAADMQTEAERSRDRSPATGPDSEPPF